MRSSIVSSEFWNQRENVVLMNPRMVGLPERSAALERAADAAGLSGHVVFATSGTSGDPKFACLSREALLASARAVNAHLQATSADHWFCVLPTFHVGGIGVYARAHLLGSGVTALKGRWDARAFCEQLIEAEATLTALVPSQVFDVVEVGLACPDSVRAVLVGGGALRRELHQAAVGLGWPLLETFGMTEAGSQIATAPLDLAGIPDAGLWVLPEWEVRLSETGGIDDDKNDGSDAGLLLEIRGEPLFSGYLRPAQDGESAGEAFSLYRPFAPCGWFRTSDRVALNREEKNCLLLRPLRRADEMVKILGENVDLGAVQEAVDPTVSAVLIVALPDSRQGMRLVAVVESGASSEVEQVLRGHNVRHLPQERIRSLAIVPEFPRTDLGKVAKNQLVTLLFNFKNFTPIDE